LCLVGCTGLADEERKKVKRMQDGEYVPGKYLYADRILIRVDHDRKLGEYTYYVGKIKGKNVISDGRHYAHCSNFREGLADLRFKEQEERGAEQYKGTPLDKEIPIEECMVMYRVITGACQAGTQGFVDSLQEKKETYTVREIIELTRGKYGAETFERFWEETV
jgi:hypothetical protein